MPGWTVLAIAVGYLLFLFLVAYVGDRNRVPRPARGHRPRPFIYALSLAVYCTSWTFFGSVGLASRTGFEFLAIYLGPILVITVGYRFYAHIVAVAKRENITSIADFIAARYGKSAGVGALAAIIAVLGTVPYIALQLKAITTSVNTMVVSAGAPLMSDAADIPLDTAAFVAVFLAVFAIAFGTRHADAREHQGGLMLAVATESLIKLAAFLIVGTFTVFILFEGPADLLAQAAQSELATATFSRPFDAGRFVVMTLLSSLAFLLLPRQFHVGVVENAGEAEVRAARWLFPGYLVLINLFVVPVALAGIVTFGTTVDPDTYVLALPIAANAQWTSVLVFVGGLSAATAMVIVACVALGIMISNNLVLPFVLSRGREMRFDANMGPTLLAIRRVAIFGVLVLAYAYVRIAGDTAALASIGLLSFAAIAQFAPPFFGAVFWRNGTYRGAAWGMGAGFAVWAYTLFLPTIIAPGSGLLENGPWGVSALRPEGLFGLSLSSLEHGVVASLFVNVVVFTLVSLAHRPSGLERVQAAAYAFRSGERLHATAPPKTPVSMAELQATVASYLGRERTRRAFAAHFGELEPGTRDRVDQDALDFAEQTLASAIGSASGRLVMSLMLKRHDTGSDQTLQLLDDASLALQQNRDLLQTAIDQVDQGISVFDERYRLSNWNRQFRTLLDLPVQFGAAGTALSDIAETILPRVVHLPDGAFADAAAFMQRLTETGVPWRMTVAGQHPRTIEVLARPLPGGGTVVSWNDITTLVTAAQALQQANETLEERVEERTVALSNANTELAAAREMAEAANAGKTRFLAAVGHDILQPLNAARLYTSSLNERLVHTRDAQLARNIDNSLESVEDILGAVLAISRLDAGAHEPVPTPFALQSLLDRLALDFAPLAEQAGLSLDVERTDLWVRSDVGLLRRLLQNLLSNAIKYTPAGTVGIRVSDAGEQVRVEVFDSGQGIGLDDQAIVFKEFHRLKAGRDVAQGLGLGLSIVQRLSHTLDHPVSLHSVVGQGSTFTVALPAATAVLTLAPIVERRSLPRSSARLQGLTVLCVDNEPNILEGMTALLGGWGCHVVTATDVQHACSFTQTPSVVVIDYHLDATTGIDAIMRIRQHYGADLPAVLVTADRSTEVAVAARESDMLLLNKPLKPAALRAFLNGVAKSARPAGRQAAE